MNTLVWEIQLVLKLKGPNEPGTFGTCRPILCWGDLDYQGYSGLTGRIGHGRFRTSRPNWVCNVQDFQSRMNLRGSKRPGLIGPAVINTNQIIKDKCLGLGDCIGSLLFTSKQDYQARMGLQELIQIREIIEERFLGPCNLIAVWWSSRPNWAWEGPLGLAVRLQDAGVSGAGIILNLNCKIFKRNF